MKTLYRMACALGLLAMATGCKSTGGSGALKSSDQSSDRGDLPKNTKYCLHSAVRASLAQAIRELSQHETKKWDDAKGGGLSVDFDPDDKEKKSNGDVAWKRSSDANADDEYGGGPVAWISYKIKVRHEAGGHSTMKSSWSTETCKTPGVGSESKASPSDDELGGAGKCSGAATRELLAWGVRNLVKDKDVDSWSKREGKDLVKVTDFVAVNPPLLGELEYTATVSGGKGPRTIVVALKSGCELVNVSEDFEIDDY